MLNGNKSKREYDERRGAGIWRIFGPVLAVLLLIIVATLVKYSVVASEEAESDIIGQISDSTQISVHQASLDINGIMAAGSVASGIIGYNGVNQKQWKEIVGTIFDSISNIYMVSIVNTSGKGVCNLKENMIDISGQNYWTELTIPYITTTEDDGIIGNEAVVCVVPIWENEKLVGYINEYIDFTEFKNLFSVEGNDASNGFIIANKDGKILLENGTVLSFGEANIYDLFDSSSLKATTKDEIKINIDINKSQNFVINYKGKDYLIFSTPLEINNWVYINVIGENYYNNLLKEKVLDEKMLVWRLAILCFATILVIVIVVVINKARDVQEAKSLENKADTDLLTGLNNKIATEKKIAKCLTQEGNTQHLLLLFDVDNFKKINDTMGHAFGDTVLKTLGEQLAQEFRKTDILGRMGGDEFAILLKDIKTDDIIIKECDKVLGFFSQFKAGGYVKYSATASIGASVFPRDGKTFEELYKSADAALYESKKQGKNRLTLANKELAQYKIDKENAAKEAALEQQ